MLNEKTITIKVIVNAIICVLVEVAALLGIHHLALVIGAPVEEAKMLTVWCGLCLTMLLVGAIGGYWMGLDEAYKMVLKEKAEKEEEES